MNTSCCCFVCVHQTQIGIVENCGRYQRLLSPGCNCIVPPCETVSGYVNLRVKHVEVEVDTKTKDNVFVKIVVAIQYAVLATNAVDAFYKLTSPDLQIKSYVYDVIRSAVPKLDLDDAFESKDHIAVAVREQLHKLMESYGYEIFQALIIDLTPDQKVKDSMNEINASQRLREAAREKAEAEKILQVKAAEAEAEAKYLSGVGVARQRRAIIDGLKDSITEFSTTVEGTSSQDVMDLLLLTQYFDMLKDVGANKLSDHTTTLFLPHGPTAVRDFKAQIRERSVKM